MITRPSVALFVTCLVDFHRPVVGFAAVKLMEGAGCMVNVPAGQTCCGQPAYNSGNHMLAQALARRMIAVLEGSDYVVVPSGSCAGMIRKHYPELLSENKSWHQRALALAAQTFEITQFLADIRDFRSINATYRRRITYHDSCSGLREMQVKSQPRLLIDQVNGANLVELSSAEVCCGFGGTFCVKYPDISCKMVSEKTADIAATGAETVLAGDMGCLMNIAGRLTREQSPVAARHVVEVLADMTQAAPPIGWASSEFETRG